MPGAKANTATPVKVINTADNAPELKWGQSLPVGQWIFSSPGWIKFGLLDNGVLCVEDTGQVGKKKGERTYFYTCIGKTGAKSLRVTKDARLQILGGASPDAIMWDSDSNLTPIIDDGTIPPDGGPYLTFADDGGMRLTDNSSNPATVTWSTHALVSGPKPQPLTTLTTSTTTPDPAKQPTATNALKAGDALVSPNGSHSLALKANGGLSLRSHGEVVSNSQQAVPGAPSKTFAVSAALLATSQLAVYGADKRTPAYTFGPVGKAVGKEAVLEVKADGSFGVMSGAAGVEVWSARKL